MTSEKIPMMRAILFSCDSARGRSDEDMVFMVDDIWCVYMVCGIFYIDYCILC